MARLHDEAIANGTPTRWLTMLHGILGTGNNWRSIAKKLVERRPDYGVRLVDLRGHGHSEHGDAPQTLAACADDVIALGGDVIAGHSFGGKVALAVRAKQPMLQTWMFDSSPGPRPDRADDPDEQIVQLLAIMERLPKQWDKRDDFVQAVVAAGQPKPIAQWLGMNVHPADHGYVLRFDLEQIRALITDYLTVDLWPSALDPAHGPIELVIATRSDVVRDPGPVPQHIQVSRVEAGHWLHVDAPDAVLELLVTRLPA
ncbi:MAG: alpha/beta hydrolase [Kofleriaceae bacterium]